MKLNKNETEERLVTYNDMCGKEKYVAIYPWSNGEGYVANFENGQTLDLSHDDWEALKFGIDFAGQMEEDK